jgi:hypothetical protein
MRSVFHPIEHSIYSEQGCFIRLRQDILRLAAGMNGEVNRAESR